MGEVLTLSGRRRMYVAYGANTCHSAMAYRCPEAEFIGAGVVVGWRLEFRGVADIVRDQTYDLEVAAWLISPRDEENLDVFEGFPRLYGKRSVLVDMGDRRRRAMVYVMEDGRGLSPPGTPYLSTLVEGYGDCGLSHAQIYEAVDRSRERGRDWWGVPGYKRR